MPLARIITRNPQDAVAVSDYLRSEGFTVETVSPAEFRITPAELELNLDRCRRGEAVDCAKALVESRRCAVLAQTEAPPVPEPAQPPKAKKPVAYDITGRPVEFADEEAAERRQEPNRTARALVSGLAGAWQAVTGPVRELRQQRKERFTLKLEAGLARKREEIRREEDLARERMRQEMERQREETELAERRRQVAAEEAERARVAALHEAMIAAEPEAACQQPSRQASPPESFPEVAAEAVNDNMSLHSPPAELAPQGKPAVAENAVPQQPPHRVAERTRPFGVRQQRAPAATLRRVVATAFGASLLLLLGFVAYANRRPASPLSPGALMREGLLKQDVPFGAATITPPAAAPKPSPIATRKTSPAVRPANRKPATALPQRTARSDPNGVMARRFPATPPQPQPSTAKLKQHSDTD
jgi:hypothetical protein